MREFFRTLDESAEGVGIPNNVTAVPGKRDQFLASSGISGHDAGMMSYSIVMVLRILQPNGYAASF